MNLLLLAGYKHAESEFWLQDQDGLPLLETRLQLARKFARSPIVVLSGTDADEILRNCPSLEKCELVFDTNGDQSNLLTNIRAGLRVEANATIIWPAEVALSSTQHIRFLQQWAVQQGNRVPVHVVQAVHLGELVNDGLPFLLTLSGRKLLMTQPEIITLTEPCVSYEYATFSAEDGLA